MRCNSLQAIRYQSSITNRRILHVSRDQITAFVYLLPSLTKSEDNINVTLFR